MAAPRPRVDVTRYAHVSCDSATRSVVAWRSHAERGNEISVDALAREMHQLQRIVPIRCSSWQLTLTRIEKGVDHETGTLHTGGRGNPHTSKLNRAGRAGTLSRIRRLWLWWRLRAFQLLRPRVRGRVSLSVELAPGCRPTNPGDPFPIPLLLPPAVLLQQSAVRLRQLVSVAARESSSARSDHAAHLTRAVAACDRFGPRWRRGPGWLGSRTTRARSPCRSWRPGPRG